MSKTFTFQEFSITRTNAAMKLTTDAVLFGSYTSECIKKQIEQSISKGTCDNKEFNIKESINVLDIGTGTGILSLIVAQKCKLFNPHIIAIDIDDGAISDAKYNIEHSKFIHLISVEKIELKEYSKDYNNKSIFDYIVCNPPYFDFSISYDDSSRYKARCNDSLSPEDLFGGVNELLNVNGSLFIIIPYNQLLKYTKVAFKNNLIVNSVKAISSVEGKDPYVALVEYSKNDKISILCEDNTLEKQKNCEKQLREHLREDVSDSEILAIIENIVEYESLYFKDETTKTQKESEFWLSLKSGLYLNT